LAVRDRHLCRSGSDPSWARGGRFRCVHLLDLGHCARQCGVQLPSESRRVLPVHRSFVASDLRWYRCPHAYRWRLAVSVESGYGTELFVGADRDVDMVDPSPRPPVDASNWVRQLAIRDGRSRRPPPRDRSRPVRLGTGHRRGHRMYSHGVDATRSVLSSVRSRCDGTHPRWTGVRSARIMGLGWCSARARCAVPAIRPARPRSARCGHAKGPSGAASRHDSRYVAHRRYSARRPHFRSSTGSGPPRFG
jgi:hypothetical protein